MTPSSAPLSAVPSDPIPEPPSGLSVEAQALWRGYHAEWAEDDLNPDAREVAVLTEACRHLTLCGRLEAELAALGSVLVPGSRANTRVTPLVNEIDKARRTVAQLLKSISPPPDRAAIGRANVTNRWRR